MRTKLDGIPTCPRILHIAGLLANRVCKDGISSAFKFAGLFRHLKFSMTHNKCLTVSWVWVVFFGLLAAALTRCSSRSIIYIFAYVPSSPLFTEHLSPDIGGCVARVWTAVCQSSNDEFRLCDDDDEQACLNLINVQVVLNPNFLQLFVYFLICLIVWGGGGRDAGGGGFEATFWMLCVYVVLLCVLNDNGL